jgi:hypothetical protein
VSFCARVSGLAFGFAFAFVVLGVGGGKFPTPSNVELGGVEKIGGSPGGISQPLVGHPARAGGCAPSTRASYTAYVSPCPSGSSCARVIMNTSLPLALAPSSQDAYGLAPRESK